MIGKTISHYRILEELGGGGMGIVYKADDTKLDRIVALKFLPPYISNDVKSKNRFIHEAKAASALDHNNICTIHEIDETDEGQLFIVMAHYEGETLKHKIEKGRLKTNEAIDICIQVAEGLSKAHEKGIVHRDIKPANIFITSDEIVKILDFGLAKTIGQTQLTKRGDTVGTVAYMSPEQTKGQFVDQRTDIWSLGVILYEMLTGELPFKGDYDQAVIYSIINEQYNLLKSELSYLQRIIDKCLAKNPSERYNDINELKTDLYKLSERRSVSYGGKFIKKAKSNPIYLAISVISIMTIIVLGYLFIPIGVNEKQGGLTPEWENSIAVLPFDDMSSEGDQEWFCDGMTEQIITNLSKIERLKVIARTSVMKFKDDKKTIPEIGKELDVTHILEGSIRKQGDNIRVTAQLVNTKDGSHLWADDFDRKLKDIFDIQDDVSQKIAYNLFTTLSPEENQKIKTSRPKSTDAYEYYLKGEYYHEKFLGVYLQEDFNIAENMFKKSIELDPNFALPYAGLSNLYHTYWDGGHLDSAAKKYYLGLVHNYLDQALAINDKLTEIHLINFSLSTDIGEKYKSLALALKYNPNSTMAIFHLGRFYHAINLYERAINYFDKAIEEDPLNAFYFTKRGFSYYRMNDFDKAESDFKQALEINPDLVIAMYHYLIMLVEQGRIEKAEEINNRLLKSNTLSNWDFTMVLEADSGIKENPSQEYDSEIQEFMVYILRNKHEAAIKLLEEKPDAVFCWDYGCKYKILLKNIFCKKLQRYPQFKELLRQEKLLYDNYVERYGSKILTN